MFSSANIYAKEWLDIVFANRNKSYGAYQLRQLAPKATWIALGIVTMTVLGASGIAFALQNNTPAPKIQLQERVVEVILDDSEIVKEQQIEEKPLDAKEDLAQQVAQEVPAQDVVKFTEINATNVSNVKEDIAEATELLDKKKLIGNINMKGVRNGTLIPKGIFGKTNKEGAEKGLKEGDISGEENSNTPFVSVEVMPEPIGGMKKFVQWVAENYEFPQGAIDAQAKGVIEVRFIVEKDGTLSSFEVARDMGYHTATEAVKLLKKAKKWNPGIQNGQPVRVTFSLPIRLNVQNY